MAESKYTSEEIKRHRKGKPTKNNLGSHRKKGVAFPLVLCVTIGVGLLIGSKSYSVAYREVAKRSVIAQESDADGEKKFSANNIVEQAQNNLVGSDIDGVIKEIDYDNKKVTFYSLKSNETIILTATEETAYPYPNTLNNYKVGDVVTFVYNKERNITEIKKCESAWEFSDTGLLVNTDSKLVKFGDASTQHKDKAFKYTDGITTVRYKDVYKDLKSIDKLDYVTVRGYDNGTVNKAYSITIERSHGSLEIHNAEHIQDGVIKLNGEEIKLKGGAIAMNLTEGRYKIEVTGSNCDPYETEVMVTPTENATVDLSVIQVKSGVLEIDSNVTDYDITVDGTSYKYGETILLNYGEYTVRINKPDYEEFVGKVKISEDINTLKAVLKERAKLGKINVTTTPAAAKVYVDGTFIGQSPQNKVFELGSHKIEIKMDGYITETRNVSIANEGDVVSCRVNLTPIVSPYSSSVPSTSVESNVLVEPTVSPVEGAGQ